MSSEINNTLTPHRLTLRAAHAPGRCTVLQMMLHEEGLTDGSLEEVFEFIRSSNPFAQHSWGWDTGRFVDWRWAGNTLREAEHPGWFSSHCRVFRENLAIRAVRIAESGARDICIITPSEDEVAIRDLLGRLVQDRTESGLGLNLDVLDRADWLIPILRECGLTVERDTGHEWEYDLDRPTDSPRIPDGFTVETLTTNRDEDYAGIAECVRAAFNSDHDVGAALRSLEGNPMFHPALSVFARSPDGRIAAYCRGTVDPANGVCGIDPVCTHPEFQKIGLGRAVVQACFRMQRDLGGRNCYIGSDAEPAPGTYLYRALGPSSRADYSSWSIRPGRRTAAHLYS